MQTLRDIAPYLAVAACAVGLVLATLLVLVWRGLRKVRRAQSVVLGHHDNRDLVQHAEHLDERVQNMREAVEALNGKLDIHKMHLDETLTNRAILRYDAFRDAGGEQSATVALLDNHSSGLVISTIMARDFARLYVKTLDRGVPDRELSPEEEQVVAQAVPKPLSGASAASQWRIARPPEHSAAPAELAPAPAADAGTNTLPNFDDPARSAAPADGSTAVRRLAESDNWFTTDDEAAGGNTAGPEPSGGDITDRPL